MEYKYTLKKLHCAGCAVALEQKVNEIEGVTCEINFVSKSITISLQGSRAEQEAKLEEVKKTILNFDSMVEILPFEEEHNEEQDEKRERLFNIIRLSVCALVLILAILIKTEWLKITIFAIDYLLVSYKVLFSAGKNIIHGKIFDETFLMSVASIGAFIIQQYTEAIFVMLLYSVGEILEDYAVDKSRKTIKSLLQIKQPYANLVVGETESVVELSAVKVGDIIRIKPGERVPLDCVIVEGTSYLNMSAITGESKDVIVKSGDSIISGSINGSSVLLAKVSKLEAESTVSKIIELVEKASETKAKSEKFISKFAKIYTPCVMALALVIMFLPPIFLGFSATFSTYAYRALSFLVVSCPCALVISVPLTYFASLGSFARIGVIVKGASHVETLSKVNSVVFDKTGTLTEGKFEISEIFATEGHTQEEILETAAYAESFSNHRIAKSILKAYSDSAKKQINTAFISDYTEIAGKGVSANIFNSEVLVGNAKLLEDNNINIYPVSKAGTVLYISINKEFSGYIVIEDVIKEDSATAIKKLRDLNIKDISMCTGDEEGIASAISQKVGLSNYYAGLMPQGKVEIINKKIESGDVVAFVGDGINDAPSLAGANVGISMGGLGSDVAVEASDVVLMTDEPSKLPQAIKKAKRTRRIVMENIFGTIGLKILVLALIGFGISGMWLAVFADVGVTMLAILNSLRAMLK